MVPYLLFYSEDKREMDGFSFFISIFLGFIIHELIHGLCFAMYASRGFKSIKFGVKIKMVALYCLTENKKQYLDLLLLADEQESMIDRYLERGEVFVLDDNGVKAVCVVTDESDGVCELKNIAVAPESQRQGYGKELIKYLLTHYSGKYNQMIVGTGDVLSSVGFYKSCGFEYSHRIENFFIENYDHQITEDGIVLKDMVYLKREI